jgi:hypothetical protein
VTDTPAHFFGSEYQIASSAGAFTGNWTTGNGDQNGEIVDAIVAAGTGGPPAGSLMLLGVGQLEMDDAMTLAPPVQSGC